MNDNAEMMIKAAQLRSKLGEDGNSPVDIFALAQNIDKLTLVFYPMGQNLSGMCIKGKNGKSVIAVNSSMSLGRQRFTLAHEFYHLFFDAGMISICAKTWETNKEIEKNADMFASYFLMPPAELESRAAGYASKRAGGKLDIQDIIRIEQYFGVSHQAAVTRLKDTPYIDPAEADLIFRTSARPIAEKAGYTADLYQPSRPGRQYRTYGYYINQAEELMKRELVSTGKYEELLLDAFREDLVYGLEESGDIVD